MVPASEPAAMGKGTPLKVMFSPTHTHKSGVSCHCLKKLPGKDALVAEKGPLGVGHHSGVRKRPKGALLLGGHHRGKAL